MFSRLDLALRENSYLFFVIDVIYVNNAMENFYILLALLGIYLFISVRFKKRGKKIIVEWEL